MITTICLNPCFDKTVKVDELKVGQVNRIGDARVDLGGNGINVAAVAKRLGLEAECIGLMGRDGSEELTALIDREDLPHTFLQIPGHVRTNTKIISGGQGVTELNEPGPTVEEKDLKAFFELAKEKTKDSEMVVVTGSLPPGCPAAVCAAGRGTRGGFHGRDGCNVCFRGQDAVFTGAAGGDQEHSRRGGRDDRRHAAGLCQGKGHGESFPLRDCRRGGLCDDGRKPAAAERRF